MLWISNYFKARHRQFLFSQSSAIFKARWWIPFAAFYTSIKRNLRFYQWRCLFLCTSRSNFYLQNTLIEFSRETLLFLDTLPLLKMPQLKYFQLATIWLQLITKRMALICFSMNIIIDYRLKSKYEFEKNVKKRQNIIKLKEFLKIRIFNYF